MRSRSRRYRGGRCLQCVDPVYPLLDARPSCPEHNRDCQKQNNPNHYPPDEIPRPYGHRINVSPFFQFFQIRGGPLSNQPAIEVARHKKQPDNNAHQQLSRCLVLAVLSSYWRFLSRLILFGSGIPAVIRFACICFDLDRFARFAWFA